MANIQGIVSSSLYVFMQNVTMSFHTQSGGITYTTYTDVNGVYTQSVHNNWSGSLRPTGSGYYFFTNPNNSGSFLFAPSTSSRTQHWVGVKNYTSGSGTSTNPYYVLNYEDFNNIRYRTGSAGATNGIYYKLGADIDLSYFTNWIPINNFSTYFYGTLDGGNKTISNMTITTASVIFPAALGSSYIGLFGNYQSYDITKDLTLNSCSINLTGWNPSNISVEYRIGLLFGNHTQAFPITNIHVKNSTIKWVPSSELSHNYRLYFAGMVAYSQQSPSITSCSVSDSYITFWNPTTGGASWANGVSIGGIAGDAPAALYQHCFVKNSRFVIQPHATSLSFQRIGGLFTGGNQVAAKDCYVLSCSVSASNMTASAFAFNSNNAGNIENCYVALINYTETPDNKRVPFTKGLYISASYYESGTFTTTAGFTTVGITGLTTAEMKLVSSYTGSVPVNNNYQGWNFANTWDHQSITSRPQQTEYQIVPTISQSLGGYNFRNIITGSLITGSADYVQVVLANNPTVDWSFTSVSIGTKLGNAPTASQMSRVYFNGGATAGTVYAGQDLTSDVTRFYITPNTDYYLHIVKANTDYIIPILNNSYTSSFIRAITTDFSLTNTVATFVASTGSYGFKEIIGINLITGSIIRTN